ncbi:MAG: hypothetical protein GY930_01910, partial [bacterium]|nr:hypothetical protein [bacterium]
MAKSASPLCLALSVDDEIVAYPHIRLIDHYIVSLTNLQLYRDGPGPEADVWTRTIEGQGDWQLAGTGLEVALSDQVFLAEETRYTRPGSGPDAGQDDEVVLRLLLVAPPRHGKSTEVTEWLPKWFLVRYPTAPILLSTYSGDFAEKWGASHKDFLASNKAQLLPLASDGLPLTPITATNSNISFRPGKDRGEINYRGTSGSQTGTGFALGITDDPNKDAEEALSEAHRLSKSNTYTSVFGSRRTQLRGLPPPLEVMMLTRWHEGDLAGVFALEEDGETPKRGWCALRLPAVAEPGGN